MQQVAGVHERVGCVRLNGRARIGRLEVVEQAELVLDEHLGGERVAEEHDVDEPGREHERGVRVGGEVLGQKVGEHFDEEQAEHNQVRRLHAHVQLVDQTQVEREEEHDKRPAGVHDHAVLDQNANGPHISNPFKIQVQKIKYTYHKKNRSDWLIDLLFSIVHLALVVGQFEHGRERGYVRAERHD